MTLKVAVIGGGAAGFFSALSVKQHHPNADVTIIEKTSKLLSKVKISGGGRCNVTHDCRQISTLSKQYPRGANFLKKAFSQFQVSETIHWFESRGIKLKTESDGRMFPISDNSQSIIDCLLQESQRLGIKINTNQGVEEIQSHKGNIELILKDSSNVYDEVIVCAGGSPKLSGLNWLKQCGHEIVSPVPSLFTFNMPNEPVTTLMGVSVSNAMVKVQGTRLSYAGPLLITHWGMSGPAILKTSAWGARILSEKDYNFTVQVSWVGDCQEFELKGLIAQLQREHQKKQVMNKPLRGIPLRLWSFLLYKIGLRVDITWGELGSKGVNKLTNILINDTYEVKGKTTFKEEFVTCGGVSLNDIDVKTMQSKKVPNLYFAGEVMDIDGITGGFNFQAAWTTGYIAGKLNK